jgi:AcrR family transcriptional regulator
MSERRAAILDAAQRLFLNQGYAATSIADIRQASGASVGSIYHAFGSKDGIAVALVERAVVGWTAATDRARRGEGIRDLIRATVEGLLRWAAAEPDSFRILDELRSVSQSGLAGERLADILRQGRAQSRAVLESHFATGELKKLDWQLAQALVLGPTYEYLRSREHPPKDQLESDIAILTDAAWSSISN